MRQLAAAIFATGWFVLLTAARVLPQVGPDFEGIPAPLEKAVDATDLIAQARLISLANKTYPVTVIGPNGPQPSSLPTTVFTVQVIKWLKRAPHAQYKEARLEFRKVGFTADNGRGPGVDPRFPMLAVGHQYVFLLTPNQDNVVWLAYSVQGVFEERDATVWIRDPLSPLAKRWNGAPWNEFIKAIENRVAESNRRLQPSFGTSR